MNMTWNWTIWVRLQQIFKKNTHYFFLLFLIIWLLWSPFFVCCVYLGKYKTPHQEGESKRNQNQHLFWASSNLFTDNCFLDNLQILYCLVCKLLLCESNQGFKVLSQMTRLKSLKYFMINHHEDSSSEAVSWNI